jgi:hypothetical protein
MIRLVNDKDIILSFSRLKLCAIIALVKIMFLCYMMYLRQNKKVENETARF